MQGAARACSCRCRWRSASRWSRRTCSRARSCRCCRSGCCGTVSRSADERPRDRRRSTGSAMRYEPGSSEARPAARGWSCRPTSSAALAIIVARSATLGHGDLPDGRRRPVPAPAARARRHAVSSRPSSSRIDALDAIKRRGRAENVEITLGYVGTDPVELSDQRHLPVDRRPGGGDPAGGAQAEAAASTSSSSRSGSRRELARELPDVRFSFEPADIVSEVMSFGSPTPVEVAVSGPNLAETGPTPRSCARSWRRFRRSATCSTASRSTIRRSSVEVDRERAGLSGVTVAGRGAIGRRGDLVEPVRRAQLLARPQDRHRLPGAGRDPASQA